MIKVGILGATGNVGQRFIQQLAGHPWFEITALAASERSAGKPYEQVAKWRLDTDLPEEVRELTVVPTKPEAVDADLVFSALPAEDAIKIEADFAKAGMVVCSNASAHRMEKDVPLVIPEVNPEHLGLIDVQRKKRKWDGAIVTNPNCSTIMMVVTLKPLMKFGIENIHVSTMQAVSGAGYEGVPSMAIIDNMIPYIGSEEGKMETETLKLLGDFDGKQVKEAPFWVSAACHRVGVLDGHTMSIWARFNKKVTPEKVKDAFLKFDPKLSDLPTSPKKAIIVREEPDRPQPRMDRMQGNGMSISVGRIRAGKADSIQYVCMGHNTIRGAAGASVLNAELLKKKGYL
ncbi:aspartate-semialdehyde dehydrogenase [Methanocella arvoryzae]|uniref:aspartate-semialdehyde dehydrogenase n=1 Tax=Methanocella arvoryzae (strain DSM 22066 / NBRC 105507 / MRE50) TaxID=351160 RepID=Q0W684_METAR|nr:aspartate-semialdehyde dehydrogenase [Methanocella arvoryzae]CAH04849.1 aspartate-semialdehyde dehydrogenase (Asd) [uncultured archaeon]CAJ36109.1 aspartate-semialdehyde dehydrogenase [Methanocella arvoryzae MRE50]